MIVLVIAGRRFRMNTSRWLIHLKPSGREESTERFLSPVVAQNCAYFLTPSPHFLVPKATEITCCCSRIGSLSNQPVPECQQFADSIYSQLPSLSCLRIRGGFRRLACSQVIQEHNCKQEHQGRTQEQELAPLEGFLLEEYVPQKHAILPCNNHFKNHLTMLKPLENIIHIRQYTLRCDVSLVPFLTLGPNSLLVFAHSLLLCSRPLVSFTLGGSGCCSR